MLRPELPSPTPPPLFLVDCADLTPHRPPLPHHLERRLSTWMRRREEGRLLPMCRRRRHLAPLRFCHVMPLPSPRSLQGVMAVLRCQKGLLLSAHRKNGPWAVSVLK
jgi:hypothetical protein